MAKFRGKVGFGESVENPAKPGVFRPVITERYYRGDVIRNSRKLDGETQAIPELTVGNTISIVADAYATAHIFAMRYIEWAGSLWTIDNIDVQAPRLILRLGKVYNGPRPDPTP